MKKESIRKCPICEEINSEVLHQQKFVLPEGHPLSQGYDVVCCDRCGFVYADTTVSQEDYDKFYANLSKYEDKKTATGGGNSPCDADRLQKTAEFISEFITDKQAKILDIGCANGGLLSYLKKLGYKNLVGLDPSPICVENTQRLYGIEAYVGSLFTALPNLGEFDCVILSHVLEHIQNLQLAVQIIYNLTKTGGLVYLEVPNACAYVDYVIAPFQDFNTEHINHFNHPSLLNLLHQSGFTCQVEAEKVFETTPGMPYPAIYGVWSKQKTKLSEVTISSDNILKDSIIEYINKSSKLMKELDIKLQYALQNFSEVIVWGTGQLAMKLLAETSLSQAKVIAFVDSNPINQRSFFLDTPVIAPDKIGKMKQPIIVTSIIHQQAIAETIAKMNLPNLVILLG